MVLVDILKEPIQEQVPISEPAKQAGIFLEFLPNIPTPPDDFAPGFVNLGAFQLFSDGRQLDLEQFQNVYFHSNRYSPEDIKQWVTPDSSFVYVFIRIGAETKSKKRQQADRTRTLGEIVLPEFTD